MPDGSAKEVPPIAARNEICLTLHNQTGHYGRRRTLQIVMLHYWWANMVAKVNQIVSECIVCDRIEASFNVNSAVLYPLPIEGLFYRWGVDLCGPFDVTARGNEYCMICIEHYSKHLELIALPKKKVCYHRCRIPAVHHRSFRLMC